MQKKEDFEEFLAPGQVLKQGIDGEDEDGEVVLEARGNKLRVKKFSSVQVEDEFEGNDADEDGQEGEGEIAETDRFKVGGEKDGGNIEIRANNNATIVIRNKLATQTKFPLRVNLETNALIVITPKGEKHVTILPDKAVQNILAAKVLDQLGGKGGYLWQLENPTPTPTEEPTATPSAALTLTPSATPSGTLTITPTIKPIPAPIEDLPVELVLTEGDVLAYEIKGIKFKKLFGIFDIKLNKVVIVSTESGDLLEVQQNLLTRILDILSTD